MTQLGFRWPSFCWGLGPFDMPVQRLCVTVDWWRVDRSAQCETLPQWRWLMARERQPPAPARRDRSPKRAQPPAP